MTFKLPLLALSILALALAGCGSSNDSSNGGNDAAAPEPLTKTELISQADAICQDMQDKINAIPEPENMDQLESAIGKQLELSEPAIKDLKELTPPEDLASDYEAWTAKLDELQAGTEKVREAAASGSEAQVEKVVNEVDPINKEADAIGKKIGFKVCSK